MRMPAHFADCRHIILVRTSSAYMVTVAIELYDYSLPSLTRLVVKLGAGGG